MSMVTIVAKVIIIARIMFRKICDFLAVLPTYELNESLSDNEEEDNKKMMMKIKNMMKNLLAYLSTNKLAHCGNRNLGALNG